MRLNAAQPIIDQNGLMSQEFRDYMLLLGQLVPLSGSGSPEGVVTARRFSLYVDVDGAAGSVLYVKRDTDVTGDRSKGWIAV